MGTELLAYMNPDHLYLYNITDPTPPLIYHPDTFKPNYTTDTPLSNGFSKNPYLLCTATSSLMHQTRPNSWCNKSVDKLKELGNKAYNVKNYIEAISLYSQGIFKNPYATVLYSNRAAAYFGKFGMYVLMLAKMGYEEKGSIIFIFNIEDLIGSVEYAYISGY